MLTGITKLNIEHPLVSTDVYVDDTAMLTYGEKEQTLDDIANAVIDFAKFAHSLHLKLSHKGVIIGQRRCWPIIRLRSVMMYAKM